LSIETTERVCVCNNQRATDGEKETSAAAAVAGKRGLRDKRKLFTTNEIGARQVDITLKFPLRVPHQANYDNGQVATLIALATDHLGYICVSYYLCHTPFGELFHSLFQSPLHHHQDNTSHINVANITFQYYSGSICT
jgi:hypothetical protein